jgi:hypothetical protein
MLAAATLAVLLAVPAADAVELSRIALPRENWDQILASMDRQIDQAVLQSAAQQAEKDGTKLPPALVERIQALSREMLVEIMPSYEEMLDFQAGLLAKHFTAAEQKALLAFHRSPLGRKSVQVQPAVLADSMAWMQTRIQERMPPAMERMTREIRAWVEENTSQDAAPGETEKAAAKKR